MRIVIIDPSRTVLKIVAGMLTTRQHEVFPFTDARAALDLVRADPMIDALITSSELFSMSGMEVCWEARGIAGMERPLYLILMSSNRDKNKLCEALDSGADDFIGKPPTPDELHARLRAAERLSRMHRELIHRATTDALTGVLTRRSFIERVAAACYGAREGRGFSVIMLDIDHFKRVNDHHGHAAGDHALRRVAEVAAAAAPGAVFGRLGGEEFALLLDRRGLADAVACAECIRRDVAAARIELDNGPLSIAVSLGVSEWQHGDTVDHVLKRADVALYAAKHRGRDCVVAADETYDLARFDNSSGVARAPVPDVVDASPDVAQRPIMRARS